MITIKNLVKHYDNHVALNHIDLSVGKGIVLGLLGPNGAGKTTLVSILNGLVDFQEGEIEIFGMPLNRELHAIRKRSSFIPQSLALYDNLTVLENLRFFAGIQKISGNDLHHNIDYALTVNRLYPLRDQKAATLSGGQKRRLNIAIGLLNNPELLYFDEPTAGIDPESRNAILETVRSFKNDGKTVVYTSHYMPEIENICDDVAIIDHGRIICQGSLETMLQGEKGDSVLVELLHASKAQLSELADNHKGVEVIDAATLMTHHLSAREMGALLTALEAEHIALKQIRYGTTNLESLFLRLTSQGSCDV
ncbi:MAG: ABC transporter ATP-binding protein [Proteobacteria bacterium]|nr:ABC transporter ATP-binding protein [Pseudomonadota bacterium]MBU1418974.1 ABC transporter ATP-binding protein [Pseudomonadota bacterium]MBU1455238.1 ABC transporter ATP-binding protein [Pseudomonadota bacterium]